MILKALFLSLLFSINAFCQGLGSYMDQPFLVADKKPCNDIPCQIGNIWLRLKAIDNPKNVSVSNWVDEIHGWNWFTNNPGTTITNSTNGVLFNNGPADFAAILYNTNSIIVSPTQAIFMVVQPIGTANNGDEPIIGGLGANSFSYGPTYVVPQAGFTCYQQANFGYHPWARSGGFALNKVIDVMSVGGPDPVQTYTNGITALTFSGAGAMPFNCIGSSGGNSQYQKQIYVQEIIVYSNLVTLTTLNVSNLHYYATNTYGPYAP